MAKYVHVSFDTVEEFKPRIPSNRCEGEDNTIERICVSSDVFHAINAMPCGGESLWNMHQIGMPLFIHAYYLQINEEYVMKNKEVCQYVPDAYLTKEEWLLKKPNKTYRVDYIIENPMFITENTDKGILHKLVCGELKRVKYENSWQKFWIWVSGKDIIEPLNISFGRFIGNLDDEMKKQIKKRKNKEEKIMKKYEKNKELSSEEIVKKTFHVFDRFYEHLTSYPQCVTTEDIEDMKWVLDRIIPAIKEEQVLDRTFKEPNKWDEGYSHLIIFGANRKEIIEKGKTLEGWEDKFFNCHYLDDEVGMSLDVCQMMPQEAADFFCEISQDVYVYAYWSLDESQFVVRCQGEDYYDLNAEIVKKCIFDNEKIRITDNKTGYQFFIGEKASTNEELHRYHGIVLNYKNTIG